MAPANVERQAPLRPAEKALVAELVAWLAEEAETFDLPAGDLAQWRAFSTPAGPDFILNSPDLYWREANVIVTACRS